MHITFVTMWHNLILPLHQEGINMAVMGVVVTPE
jgi:hypothetical protein